MKYVKQTIVLFQSPADSERVCDELKQHHVLCYKLVESINDLHALLEQGNVPLIFVNAPQLPLNLTVVNLRTLVGLGGLIVAATLSQPEQITDLLLAGADSVVSGATVTHTELLAWKTVLLRRAEGFLRLQEVRCESKEEFDQSIHEAVNELQVVWRLADGGWRLISPSGVGINLTSSERFFLEHFVGQVDKCLSREELLEKNTALTQNSRAIDSLISRLRRKVMQKNLHLPIKSVHGWGYSFTGLLLDEDSGLTQALVEKNASLNPPEAAYLTELSSRAQFEEQLQNEKFEFLYHPVCDTVEDRIVGAFAVLVWKDSEGRQIRVEHLVPHLEAFGLLEALGSWAIVKLNRELVAWDIDYAVTIPIYVGMPASMLLQKHTKLERYADFSIAKQLTVIIQNLDHTIDASTLKAAIQKLKQNGMAVWARYEDESVLPMLKTQMGFEGVSFWRLTDGVIRGHTSQSIGRALDYAKQQHWPTLVVDVDNAEQRRLSQFLEIRYVAGGMIAMELSRDGLLLAWASHQVEP